MSRRRVVLRVLAGIGVAAGVGFAALLIWLENGPNAGAERTVRDVTELIEIDVERVARPTSAEEVQLLLARHEGPISIGGGRFSMGGQIGTDGALFLDLREMDDVLALDVEGRIARVEAGITWRKLIEELDRHDLSVKIMQSYANFTVGGTLSVNAHGRYVGLGPVVHSVRAIELVLADGSLVRATPTEHADLFYGAIGGYGALGVIATVELDLADNVRLERTVDRMEVAEFTGWFDSTIRPSETAVMFNADLYPPAYEDLVAITFSETERPVTDETRIQPEGGSSSADRALYWWVSETDLGKEARADVLDKLRLATRPVVWRNAEATYDVHGLDPGSREKSTYVLQEYFVPVARFDDFVPKMRAVFQKHDVNVVNVSIRHATPDPGTLLAWAPDERFAFVVYHKMGTSPEAWSEAETWTREMIDEVLSVGGTYYLPYQIHATPAQFHEGYPRAVELFHLKRAYDPDYTFRSRLWDAYLPDYGAVHDEEGVRAKLAARPTWARPEDQTFLTLPEWLQVYCADELGAFLAVDRPSRFPWFGELGQFWEGYRAVWGLTRARYPFNVGYHAMIGVIGASFTVEMVAKGLYEESVGRFTEWWSGPERTPEEDLYAAFAADYGAFIHHTPWYAFPFAETRAGLWTIPPGPWSVRRGERFVAIWVELTAKSAWATVIAWATGAAYGTEEAVVEAWVRGDVPEGEDLGGGDRLLELPRYEPFTAAVVDLVARDVEIVEVSGGRTIMVQVRADDSWEHPTLWGDVVWAWPVLTGTDRRYAIEVAVRRLDEVLPALQADGVTVERLYDY